MSSVNHTSDMAARAMQQQRKKTSAEAKPWEKKKEDDDAEPMAAAAAATRKRSKSDARKYDTNVNQYKRQAGQVVREHKRRHPLPPSSSEKKNLPEQEEDEQMEEEGEIDSIDEILDVDNFHAVEPLENAEQQQQPKLTMAEFMNMDPVEQQRRLVQDRVGRDAERLALLQKDAAFQGSAALYKTVGERFWEDEPEKEEEEEGVPVDEEEEEGVEIEEEEQEQYDNDRGRGLNRMSTRTFIELAQDKLNAEPQNDALRNVIDHAQRGLYKPGRTDGWGPNCIIPHLHHAGQYEMARDVQNNLFDFSK